MRDLNPVVSGFARDHRLPYGPPPAAFAPLTRQQNYARRYDLIDVRNVFTSIGFEM